MVLWLLSRFMVLTLYFVGLSPMMSFIEYELQTTRICRCVGKIAAGNLSDTEECLNIFPQSFSQQASTHECHQSLFLHDHCSCAPFQSWLQLDADMMHAGGSLSRIQGEGQNCAPSSSRIHLRWEWGGSSILRDVLAKGQPDFWALSWTIICNASRCAGPMLPR